MLETFLLICATVGGTILVLRTALALLGLGLGEVAHLGDLGDHGDVPDVGHPPDGSVGDHHDGQWHIGKILSIQAVLSFVTFFGIGGLSALERGASQGVSAVVAFAVGASAMLMMGWLLSLLRKLQSDGSVRLGDAVGARGRIYLRVPGQGDGVGKVTLVLQGRTVELEARTPGPELRTGEEVVVSRVLDDRTVEVVAPSHQLVKPVPLV